MKSVVFALLLGPTLAAAAPFSYTENFQGSVGSEWSTGSTTATPADANRVFLGRFTNDIATLTLTGLTPGVAVTVGFDLFPNDSLDGNNSSWGPDRISLTADGTFLLNASFSNVVQGGFEQTYSAGNPLGGTLVPAQTNADETGTTGYDYVGSGSVYKFGGPMNAAFTFVPATSTISLAWSGTGLQDLGDESWGIDNVSVTQAAPVPEPASMAVLGLGLAALKRRRKNG